MHAARRRRGLWLDLESLVASLLGPNQQLVVVHYFTALVVGPGRMRQQTYLDALEAHGQVTATHVGHFQHKQHRCRACGATWTSYEEKESDVSLGVQLVEDAARGVYDQALIVSGDSDMAPAIRSVQRLAPAARLVAVFPPKRSSVTLQRQVDAALHIFDKVPERHQLPDPVVTPDGATLGRPAYWR